MAYTYKHGDRPLEGYTIQRGVGRGGFGEVYYAMSDGGREVALKYLRDNSDVELRGVSQCMNLKSPHLVTIFDVKRNADGEFFIIMEYISGPSLAELLQAESNGLGVEKAAFFVREIGKGLAYLHDRGIVHRDMKPANIFYEDGHVKIGDYGLSKFISVSRHSAQTTSVGTVHYMAPEVGSGNYHRGIDIYALGVMLYEMLLGKVPFEGSSMGEVLMKHLTEQPEVSDLPQPFGKVIRKALAKEPKDRYQNVNEMLDDILEVSTVRDSLAGFNPVTITAIPRRPRHDPMKTPVPSPNPARRVFPPPPPVSPSLDMRHQKVSQRIQRRMDRIQEKVHRKMDKLAGRPHRRRPTTVPAGSPSHAMRGPQRVVLSFLIMAGAAVGVGLLTGGVIAERAEVGATAGMMVVAILMGIRLTDRVVRWIGESAQPRWVQHLITLACCIPLMAIANAPVFSRFEERGFALPIGLLAMVLFGDWDRRLMGGARGDLSFGNAFSAGLGGLIFCVMAAGVTDAGHEEMWMTAGAFILAVVSLVMEATAWFLPPRGLAGGDPDLRNDDHGSKVIVGAAAFGTGDEADGVEAAARSQTGAEVRRKAREAYHRRFRRRDIPAAVSVPPGTPASGWASLVPVPRLRSGFSRAAYSLIAFLMLIGCVVSTVLAATLSFHRDERAAVIVGAGACFSFMIFAAQKLTLRKRAGFWRETLCPFLLALSMIAVCATISVLVVMNPPGEGFGFTIAGIVASGLTMMVLLVARVIPPRSTHPVASPSIGAFVAGAVPGHDHPGPVVKINIESDGGAAGANA